LWNTAPSSPASKKYLGIIHTQEKLALVSPLKIGHKDFRGWLIGNCDRVVMDLLAPRKTPPLHKEKIVTGEKVLPFIYAAWEDAAF
jgi:hypothetical protein